MHAFLVVIYKEKLRETVTFKSLEKMASIASAPVKLYVWDNSPQGYLSECESADSDLFNIKQYKCYNNERLSVVYNKIADEVFSTSNARYLTILDQDSEIAPDFLASVNSANAPDVLLLPKVISNKTGKLLSPRYQKYNYIKNKCEIEYLTNDINSGLHSAVNFFAVGSGMTISRSVWKQKIRFDEKLSFYGVDTEFCADYAKVINHIYILNSVLLHSASNEQAESVSQHVWRFNKYMEHWQYQLEKYTCLPWFVSKIYVSAYKFIYFLYKRLLNV